MNLSSTVTHRLDKNNTKLTYSSSFSQNKEIQKWWDTYTPRQGKNSCSHYLNQHTKTTDDQHNQDNTHFNTKGCRGPTAGKGSAREHFCTFNGRYASKDQHNQDDSNTNSKGNRDAAAGQGSTGEQCCTFHDGGPSIDGNQSSARHTADHIPQCRMEAAQEDPEDHAPTAINQSQAMEAMQVKDTTEDEDTEQAELEEPTKLSPKEWRCKHNLWLHSVMGVAVGDELANGT